MGEKLTKNVEGSSWRAVRPGVSHVSNSTGRLRGRGTGGMKKGQVGKGKETTEGREGVKGIRRWGDERRGVEEVLSWTDYL
jgi:hypothetical protein